VSSLSYQDDWPAIVRLAERAEPPARRLSEHGDLAADALSRAALEEVAGEVSRRGFDRAQDRLAAAQAPGGTPAGRDEARKALDLAILWSRLGYPSARSGSLVRMVLPAALHGHAISLNNEAIEVLDSGDVASERDRLAAALPLLAPAVAELEEAHALKPDDDVIAEHLASIRQLHAKVELGSLGLPGFGGPLG